MQKTVVSRVLADNEAHKSFRFTTLLVLIRRFNMRWLLRHRVALSREMLPHDRTSKLLVLHLNQLPQGIKNKHLICSEVKGQTISLLTLNIQTSLIFSVEVLKSLCWYIYMHRGGCLIGSRLRPGRGSGRLSNTATLVSDVPTFTVFVADLLFQWLRS